MLPKGIRLFTVFIVMIAFCVNTIFSSIIIGTLIHTSHGYVPAEELVVGDELVSYQAGALVTTRVTHISTTITDRVVVITTEKGSFYACSHQQFFDPVLEQWVVAKDITTHTVFLDNQCNHCTCLAVCQLTVPATQVYRISVSNPHNFLQLIKHY